MATVSSQTISARNKAVEAQRKFVRDKGGVLKQSDLKEYNKLKQATKDAGTLEAYERAGISSPVIRSKGESVAEAVARSTEKTSALSGTVNKQVSDVTTSLGSITAETTRSDERVPSGQSVRATRTSYSTPVNQIKNRITDPDIIRRLNESGITTKDLVSGGYEMRKTSGGLEVGFPMTRIPEEDIRREEERLQQSILREQVIQTKNDDSARKPNESDADYINRMADLQRARGTAEERTYSPSSILGTAETFSKAVGEKIKGSIRGGLKILASGEDVESSKKGVTLTDEFARMVGLQKESEKYKDVLRQNILVQNKNEPYLDKDVQGFIQDVGAITLFAVTPSGTASNLLTGAGIGGATTSIIMNPTTENIASIASDVLVLGGLSKGMERVGLPKKNSILTRDVTKYIEERGLVPVGREVKIGLAGKSDKTGTYAIIKAIESPQQVIKSSEVPIETSVFLAKAKGLVKTTLTPRDNYSSLSATDRTIPLTRTQNYYEKVTAIGEQPRAVTRSGTQGTTIIQEPVTKDFLITKRDLNRLMKEDIYFQTRPGIGYGEEMRLVARADLSPISVTANTARSPFDTGFVKPKAQPMPTRVSIGYQNLQLLKAVKKPSDFVRTNEQTSTDLIRNFVKYTRNVKAEVIKSEKAFNKGLNEMWLEVKTKSKRPEFVNRSVLLESGETKVVRVPVKEYFKGVRRSQPRPDNSDIFGTIRKIDKETKILQGKSNKALFESMQAERSQLRKLQQNPFLQYTKPTVRTFQTLETGQRIVQEVPVKEYFKGVRRSQPRPKADAINKVESFLKDLDVKTRKTYLNKVLDKNPNLTIKQEKGKIFVLKDIIKPKTNPIETGTQTTSKGGVQILLQQTKQETKKETQTKVARAEYKLGQSQFATLTAEYKNTGLTGSEKTSKFSETMNNINSAKTKSFLEVSKMSATKKSLASKSKQYFASLQNQELKLASKMATEYKLDTKQGLRLDQKLKQDLRTRLDLKLKQGTKNDLFLEKMQEYNYKLRQEPFIYTPTRLTTKNPTPKLYPINFDSKDSFFSTQKKTKKYGDVYQALLKIKGKYQPIGDITTTKEAALDIGTRAVKNRLEATFKIKKVKGLGLDIKPTGAFQKYQQEFRTYKIKKGKKIQLEDEYIQRRGTRLGTQSEINLLQQTRKKRRKIK